jgi:hypothetical protein
MRKIHFHLLTLSLCLALSFFGSAAIAQEAPPPKVTSVTLNNSADLGSLRLSWNTPGNGNFTDYSIYRSLRRKKCSQLLVTGISKGTTSYTDDDVLPGVRYFYSIQTLNSTGVSECSRVVALRAKAKPAKTYSVSGRALFSDGTAVTNINVKIEVASNKSENKVFTTDDNGVFKFTGLNSSSYNIYVISKEYQSTPQNFSAPIVITNADSNDRNLTISCNKNFVRNGENCLSPENIASQPTNLKASDGTSPDHVEISWSAKLAENFEIFRSPYFGNDPGISVGAVGGDTFAFRDISAVPGIQYYYRIRAYTEESESVFSDPEGGFRGPLKSQTGQIDSSSGLNLINRSPAFVKYNTFSNNYNFLGLTAIGTEDVNVAITVFSQAGVEIRTINKTLFPQQQVDFDIGSIVNTPDSYGLVRVSYDDSNPNKKIVGRMSIYRYSPAAGYSYVFIRELSNARNGTSTGIVNTQDPSGGNKAVFNWLEILNTDSQPRNFRYTIYNSNGGKVFSSDLVTLAPFAELDFEGGHNKYNQGNYLIEVTPEDGNTSYIAGLTRFRVENSPREYSFGYASPLRTGTGANQYLFNSNLRGGCWSQTNYLEIANTREKPVQMTVNFRNSTGSLLSSNTTTLNSRSQVQLDAARILPVGNTGSAEIFADAPDSIIANSAVTYFDCKDNTIQSAYATYAMIPGNASQNGYFNSFVGQRNNFNLLNTQSNSTNNLQYKVAFTNLGLQLISLPSLFRGEFSVGTNSQITTPADIYGPVQISSPTPLSFISENVISREINGRVEFVYWNALR